MTNERIEDGWRGVVMGRPEVGQVAERSRRTSMSDVVAFTNITGDKNPLHYDESLASGTVFGGLIVQGGVTSGLLNAIVAEDLPGPGTVFLEVNWKFVKAIRVGGLMIGRVEILKVRNDKPICQIATSVKDGTGAVCLSGAATVYTVPLAR